MNKNNLLEILRGIAALTVLLSHIFGKIPYFSEHSNFVTRLLGSWGTEAVLIFFVLSGIVIAISQEKTNKTPIKFLENRLLRIYPIMIFSIIISIISAFVIYHQFPPQSHILGNLFFLGTLQGHIVPSLEMNPVLWSLSFEMFFYFIFSLTIGKNQNLLLKIWFTIAVISCFFYYTTFNLGILNHIIAALSYSTIWLMGYYLYKIRLSIKISSFTALLFASLLPLSSRIHFSSSYYDISTHILFALTSLPFFLFLIQRNSQNLNAKSKLSIVHFFIWYFILMFLTFIVTRALLSHIITSSVTNKILYSILPLLATGIYILYKKIQNQIKPLKIIIKNTFIYTGSISYSIYCIHYPILLLSVFLFKNRVFYTLLFLIISTLIFSILLERIVQPKLNRLIKKHN